MMRQAFRGEDKRLFDAMRSWARGCMVAQGIAEATGWGGASGSMEKEERSIECRTKKENGK